MGSAFKLTAMGTGAVAFFGASFQNLADGVVSIGTTNPVYTQAVHDYIDETGVDPCTRPATMINPCSTVGQFLYGDPTEEEVTYSPEQEQDMNALLASVSNQNDFSGDQGMDGFLQKIFSGSVDSYAEESFDPWEKMAKEYSGEGPERRFELRFTVNSDGNTRLGAEVQPGF